MQTRRAAFDILAVGKGEQDSSSVRITRRRSEWTLDEKRPYAGD